MSERLAILISGGGTIMQEIIKASKSGEVPIDVACVISSSPTAGGIEKARNLRIPEEDIIIVDPNDFRDKDKKLDQESFGQAILNATRQRGVTVVTQNGWMPLTPVIVIDEYPDAMFNQHPGPVPEFGGKGMYGRRVHAARLMFVRSTKREEWTEVTAQRVHRDFDQGAVVKTARVKILPNDTVEDVQQRVLPVEHEVQIALLKNFAQRRVEDLPLRESLIRPGEEELLRSVKHMAKLLYPEG